MNIATIWGYRSDFIFQNRLGANFIDVLSQSELSKLSPNLKNTDEKWRLSASRYETGRIQKFKFLLKSVNATDINWDYFIDIGSGKGKIVFFAERKNFARQYIGVEMDNYLTTQSQIIASSNYSSALFINIDAQDYNLPKGNGVIYFFNPFSEAIFMNFLTKNADVITKNKIIILYENDVYALILKNFGFTLISHHENCSAWKNF